MIYATFIACQYKVEKDNYCYYQSRTIEQKEITKYFFSFVLSFKEVLKTEKRKRVT
jgi:hypothetical protein